MKMLNRKGYLAVELVMASAFTFLVAFFLFDITMMLVNKTNDAYVDTLMSTDKALITRNIKEELYKYMCESGPVKTINSFSPCSGTSCTIRFSNSTTRVLSINSSSKNLSFIGYTKKLNDNFNNISISGGIIGSYANIKISSKNIFSDEDYEINIIVYNGC